MAKEIRLFIGRDPRSLELFKAINELLKELPPGERPKLRVKTFKIKDPSQFGSFIKQLEELFGGMYTVEIRKYGVKAIPAIVVDGEKVVEGEYPSLEKLREILLGPSLVAEASIWQREASPPTRDVSPLPPIAPPAVEEPPSEEAPLLAEQAPAEEQLAPPPPPTVHAEAPSIPLEESARVPERPLAETEIRATAPVEEPEEFKLEEEEPPIAPPVTPPKPLKKIEPPKPEPRTKPAAIPPPRKTEKPVVPPRPRKISPPPPRHSKVPPPPKPPVERAPAPKPKIPRIPEPAPRPVQRPALRETRPPPPAAPKPREEAAAPTPAGAQAGRGTIDLSKTCLSCIFYSKERGRCTLYHIAIEDPYNPPPICDRVKR